MIVVNFLEIFNAEEKEWDEAIEMETTAIKIKITGILLIFDKTGRP